MVGIWFYWIISKIGVYLTIFSMRVTFLRWLFNYFEICANSISFSALHLFYLTDFSNSKYTFRPSWSLHEQNGPIMVNILFKTFNDIFWIVVYNSCDDIYLATWPEQNEIRRLYLIKSGYRFRTKQNKRWWFYFSFFHFFRVLCVGDNLLYVPQTDTCGFWTIYSSVFPYGKGEGWLPDYLGQ